MKVAKYLGYTERNSWVAVLTELAAATKPVQYGWTMACDGTLVYLTQIQDRASRACQRRPYEARLVANVRAASGFEMARYSGAMAIASALTDHLLRPVGADEAPPVVNGGVEFLSTWLRLSLRPQAHKKTPLI